MKAKTHYEAVHIMDGGVLEKRDAWAVDVMEAKEIARNQMRALGSRSVLIMRTIVVADIRRDDENDD